MINLPRLEARQGLEELVFHLKGLVEAFDYVNEQLRDLDSALEEDLETATTVLGRLDAEFFTHIPYHLKELRKPFSLLFTKACKDLDRLERESKRLAKTSPGGIGRKRRKIQSQPRKAPKSR